VNNPEALFSTLMDFIIRLAEHGLIHGDFNEFNIMLNNKTQDPFFIDFPQMVSTNHRNASL
jgi:RIO kinase 2